MKNFQWKLFLPHLIAIGVFVLVALLYCKPALQGKVLEQHDVTQWKGMFEDMRKYEETHGNFPLWTNGMFSGMPGYQIAIAAANPISIINIQNILMLGMAKPAYFFFIACICFYFLSQVLRINPYVGIIGSLTYAYATYNPIIIGAGHDTKMMAIAYLPFFISSLILVYEKKYLWGAALTALSAGLLIAANHMQITYYGAIIAVFMSAAYTIHWFKTREFKHLFISLSIVLIAGIAGILVNSVTLFTTYEYSKKTIRGGSVLADAKSNQTKTGLSTDYALSYSFYKTEPLVLMFPQIYGGSSNNLEVAEDKSKAIEALQQMPQQLSQQLQSNLQFYWGGIDGVGTSGPPYAGAIICFLALIGFVLLDQKHKWWILAACIFTILMSWGKYFQDFNVLLLKYLPMYDKFRAPSMIMVVPTFLMGMMAMLTIQKIIDTENKVSLWLPYRKGLIVAGSMIIVAILVYLNSDFMTTQDHAILKNINEISDPQQKAAISQPVLSFINGLKTDRQSLFIGSIIRSLAFMLVPCLFLGLYIKNKLNATIVIAFIGVFAFIDIMMVDVKYLNEEHYQDATEADNNFKPTNADIQISADTSYYRVFDITRGVTSAFNAGAINSYFHKSIGGYHPAKLSIYQDLIEKQLYNFPNCMPVINMLNTKYIIMADQKTGQAIAQQNPNALGACWFVKALHTESTPAAVMNALTNFNPKDTAIIFEQDKALATISSVIDTTAKIKLIKNDNDIIEYQSSANSNQFAVFSEVFYDKGWKAWIDEKESPIIQTNYVLRGLSIPAGNHKIIFQFKPASYYSSIKVATFSSALIWLLILGAIANSVVVYRKKIKA